MKNFLNSLERDSQTFLGNRDRHLNKTIPPSGSWGRSPHSRRAERSLKSTSWCLSYWILTSEG